MTFFTEEADMPWIELPTGYYFALEAVDPTAGTAVTGVSVSQVAVYGDQAAGQDVDVNIGPYQLVPGPVPVGNPGDGASVTGGQ